MLSQIDLVCDPACTDMFMGNCLRVFLDALLWLHEVLHGGFT